MVNAKNCVGEQGVGERQKSGMRKQKTEANVCNECKGGKEKEEKEEKVKDKRCRNQSRCARLSPTRGIEGSATGKGQAQANTSRKTGRGKSSPSELILSHTSKSRHLPYYALILNPLRRQLTHVDLRVLSNRPRVCGH
jgi:hypothetical protein